MIDTGSLSELCIVWIITEYRRKVLMAWLRVVVVQMQVGELEVFLKGIEKNLGKD